MIRQYEQKDWKEVCRIHDAARMLELRSGGVDARAFRPMQEAADDDQFHVSETIVFSADQDLMGFASWKIDYITWLYVDPAMHRKGIGKQLLSSVLNSIGPDAWTSVLSENMPARLLYESAGMELVWDRPGHCEGYACNVARMALPTSRMHAQRLTGPI